jgi:hypothetical protein
MKSHLELTFMFISGCALHGKNFHTHNHAYFVLMSTPQIKSYGDKNQSAPLIHTNIGTEIESLLCEPQRNIAEVLKPIKKPSNYCNN